MRMDFGNGELAGHRQFDSVDVDLVSLVTQLCSIHSNGATAPEFEEIKERANGGSAEAGKKEQAETMLEAHEALCKCAPENFSRFKDVLDYLKQDLHQTAK